MLLTRNSPAWVALAACRARRPASGGVDSVDLGQRNRSHPFLTTAMACGLLHQGASVFQVARECKLLATHAGSVKHSLTIASLRIASGPCGLSASSAHRRRDVCQWQACSLRNNAHIRIQSMPMGTAHWYTGHMIQAASASTWMPHAEHYGTSERRTLAPHKEVPRPQTPSTTLFIA